MNKFKFLDKKMIIILIAFGVFTMLRLIGTFYIASLSIKDVMVGEEVDVTNIPYWVTALYNIGFYGGICAITWFIARSITYKYRKNKFYQNLNNNLS